MRYTPLGDTALTVTPGDAGPPAATLADALLRDRPAGVVDVIAAFDGVTVLYDAAALAGRHSDEFAGPPLRLRTWIETTAAAVRASASKTAGPHGGRLVELHVHYGGGDGPDLLPLAATVGLPPLGLVSLHAAAEYVVAAVGFLPGFAYLTGLDARLQVPRRATPRLRVPAGSVAVGGPYTGVYPVESPGGWHVIGRTTRTLFDPADPAATPLRVGDRVRFVPARVGKDGR